MLFGVNALSPVLLKIINLEMGIIPRFRDCYIDGEYIIVHTRSGGGNREWLEEENNMLEANENYSHDEDDDFDCTYANFYFNIPSEYAEDINALVNKDETYKPSEKWAKLFEGLEKKDEN
jgi:hypothetical protein